MDAPKKIAVLVLATVFVLGCATAGTREAPAAADDGPSTVDVAAASRVLQEQDSYEMDLTVTMTMANGTRIDPIVVQMSHERKTSATEMIITMPLGSESTIVHAIALPESTYAKIGDAAWIAGPGSLFAAYLENQGTLDPSILEQLQDPARVGPDETIIGTRVRRFGFDGVRLDRSAAVKNLPVDSTLGPATVEVWVGVETGILLRYRLTVEFSNPQTGDVDMVTTLDVTGVNRTLGIRAPDGVAASAFPVDIPFEDGAMPLTSTDTQVGYVTPVDLETVLRFYLRAMPEAGWKANPAVEGLEQQGFLIYGFTKGNRGVLVMMQQVNATGTAVILYTESGR